jgi:SAM-dependent methyltransferase
MSDAPPPRQPTRWEQMPSRGGAAGYTRRFAELAASGVDTHGEAALCASLVPPGSRVLDAGCGTGRVAIRLAELGYRCVGVDADSSMLDQARAASGDVAWMRADLAEELDDPVPFDLVVAAGNVIPLLAAGTELPVLSNLTSYLVPDGLLVTGFGLDPAHLPLDQAPFDLAEFDQWCEAAGLRLQQRFSTWGEAPWDEGGYAVSVHSRRSEQGYRESLAAQPPG